MKAALETRAESAGAAFDARKQGGCSAMERNDEAKRARDGVSNETDRTGHVCV